MMLCFSTLACPGWNLRQMVDACAANGIGGIDFRGVGEEIDITRSVLFTGELDSTLQLLRDAGVEMPCLNTSVVLVSPAAERWQMMLDEAQRYALLAGQTGTRWLRVFGGRVPKDISRDEARFLAQRHLRQVVKICKPHGCRPLLETHDDWATSAQVLELLHEFDPADVGVIWDVEHPFRRGESPPDTTVALRKFLRHVHVKDSVCSAGGEHVAKLLGDGELPLRECVRVLEQVDYPGWICLETEKRWRPSAPEPEASISQFAQYMRQIGSGNR